MDHYTRVTLLERIKNSHTDESWNDFVAIYRPYICSVIKNLGVENAEIDDLMQAVFITCWEKLPEFEYDPQQGKFRYWLCRITTWTCNNHLRKSVRRSRILADDFDYDNEALTPEIEEIVDSEWKTFISNKAWENVRETLSGKMLQTYVKFLKNESLEDIAQDLSITRNTVQVYCGRVEKRIIAEIQMLKVELG